MVGLEASDRNVNRIELEPRFLLCLNCKRGGGDVPHSQKLEETLQQIDKCPDLHITMKGAFDEIGARTELFDLQIPAERRKDLDVLQRIGLCFGDTRTARDLLYRISIHVPDLKGICAYHENEYGTWSECPLSRSVFFEKGNKPLSSAQPLDVMAKYKEFSCKALAEADHVVIRAHHLLCIVCYIGRGDHVPLAEDNLYEAWLKFRVNPDIPVIVIEGSQRCCICPPCHSYKQDRGICVAGCHLRDRKKDLDVCVAIGITPGDTLTARELYNRIYNKISDNSIICGYDKDTSTEWTSCNTVGTGSYKQGLDHGVITT